LRDTKNLSSSIVQVARFFCGLLIFKAGNIILSEFMPDRFFGIHRLLILWPTCSKSHIVLFTCSGVPGKMLDRCIIFRALETAQFFCSDEETKNMKIYVGNMPFSMDESQTRSLFAEFGEVDSVNVITDRESGRPRGFAFVEMGDEDARKAISELHEREVDGRRLNVNEARPRENRGGGGGGGRGRY
jgi:hypothetical protein